MSNIAGTVDSAAATLTVQYAPVIAGQPQNQTAVAGRAATFSVTANAVPSPGYQWYFNGNPIPGANNSSYTVLDSQPSNAGNYSVRVSNSRGSITSAPATLTVGFYPTITIQPQGQGILAGGNVTFSVAATGTAPLAYQWQRNGISLVGATDATYAIASVQTNDTGNYSVIVSNPFGNQSSAAAALTVFVPPAITTQPQNRTVVEGDNVIFTVTANAVPSPSYQWWRNGANVVGATNSSYTITGVVTNQAGNYTVVIKNSFGSVASDVATLTVLVPFHGIYNTGLSDSRTVLADGQVDPHYKLVANPNNPASSSSVAHDSTLFPIVNGPWIQNSSQSKWIGPARDTTGAASGNYSYRMTLDLTGYDPGTAFLAGSWATDNEGSIFLNGADTGVRCTGFSALLTFTLTNGFVSGTNLIEFRVSNDGSWTGLRVENLRGTAQKLTDRPLRIVAQPTDATKVITDNVTFTVVAGGAPPLSYQWRFNGDDIPTATGASLALTNLQLSQAGNYDVIVSNNSGSVTSAVATLTVGIWDHVHFDFETAETTPVWLGATQMVQNTSASHQGTNAITFTGNFPDFYILTELPQGTTNVEFFFYDVYGPNPPLYQYMSFWLLEATNAEPFAGFMMNDGGWGTAPPRTSNHYYAFGNEEYSASTSGPLRTIGWHKFTFAIRPESVALSVDGTLVFQTNMIRTPRYLKLALCDVCAGWGRMDDLVLTGVTVTPPALTASRIGNGVRVAWPVSATGFVLQETVSAPGNWSNSSAVVGVQGNENAAVIPITDTAKFYRLRK